MNLFCQRLFYLAFTVLSACGTVKKPSYTVAVDPSFYSIESLGRENNILAFLTDLVSEASLRTHLSITMKPANWTSLLQGLQEEEYQAVFAGITQYNFTEKKYAFSSVFIKTGPVLIIPKNMTSSSLTDFGNKEVGVISDSDAINIVQKYPDIIIRIYDSIPKLLNDLSQNRIEAAVLAALPAEGYCRDLFQESLHITTSPMTNDGLKLITLKEENIELMHAFNKVIQQMEKEGSLAKLKAKWSLGS
ncbi:MAG: transporter substrate-binding domain-containing protein [Chlamydiia bacterium]